MKLAEIQNSLGAKSRSVLAGLSLLWSTSLCTTLSSCNDESSSSISDLHDSWKESIYRVNSYNRGIESELASTLKVCDSESCNKSYIKSTGVSKRNPTVENSDSIARWLWWKAEIIWDNVQFIVGSSTMDPEKTRKTDLLASVYEYNFEDISEESLPIPWTGKLLTQVQFECWHNFDTITVDLDQLGLESWQSSYYSIVLTPNIGQAPCHPSQESVSGDGRLMTKDDLIESKENQWSFANQQGQRINHHIIGYYKVSRE